MDGSAGDVPSQTRCVTWQTTQTLTAWIVGAVGSALQLFSLCEHVTPHGRHCQAEDGFPSMALWRNYFRLPSTEFSRNPSRTSTVLERSTNSRRHSRTTAFGLTTSLKWRKTRCSLPTT